jgi:hypothetical protein
MDLSEVEKFRQHSPLAQLLRQAAERGFLQSQGLFVDADPRGNRVCAMGAAYCVAHGFQPDELDDDESFAIERWADNTFGQPLVKRVIQWNDASLMTLREIADALESGEIFEELSTEEVECPF